MHRAGRIVMTMALLLGLPGLAHAEVDAKLAYQFKGGDRFFYRLTEKIEDDAGASATVAYVGFELKTSRSQLELNYGASMATRPMAAGGVMPDIPPNPNLFDHNWSNRLTIDRQGKVVGNDSHQDTGMPGAIAQNWQIPVPELGGKGQNSWQSSRTINVAQRSGFGSHGPMMLHMNQQSNRATITNNYSLHDAQADTDGKTIAVDFTTSLDTQGNAAFSEHASGNGSFVFDSQRGIVQSLNEKLSATATVNGKDQHATLTIELQLLEKEEVDRLTTDAKTRADEMQKLKEKLAARVNSGDAAVTKQHDHTWVEQLNFPADTQHTDFVGHSNGGGPFVDAGDGKRPMIGLKYRTGNWMGHPCISSLQPLYEKPGDAHPLTKDEVTVLPKDGYVIGGFWGNAHDGLDAVRVIFMKKTDKGVDPKDAYVSPWIGTPSGEERIKLGCTGEWIVGLYGRQGLNTDAFGLVMKAAAGAKVADPTDNPDFAGTNVPAKTPAK